MEQPSIGLLRTITAGFTEKMVKPGSHISFTVQKKIGENSWVVRMLGQKIRVVSDLQLRVGERLKATVQFESGKLLLKIDQQSHALNSILQNSSLADTAQNRALLQAFVAQGLPLREESLKTAFKLFYQLEVQDKATARLLAILQDKGLLLTPDQIKRLQVYVFGEEHDQRDPHHNKNNDSGQNNQQNQNNQSREHGRQGSEQRGGEHKGTEQNNSGQEGSGRQSRRKVGPGVSATVGLLKEQILRRGEGDPLLHLFNHRKAAHQNWIVVPLSFKNYREFDTQKDIPDTGIVRLELSPEGKPLQFTLSLEDLWHFSGKMSPIISKIRVYQGKNGHRDVNKEILSKLRQKLNNLPFEIDDTIREASEFNPFGIGAPSSFKRVDTSA